MNEIYFGTKDGDLLDGYDIAKIAYVTSGERISLDDLDSVRDFAKTCKGITREIKNPSVKRLIENGHKIKAIKIYYEKHPEIRFKEAKEIADSIEENMNKSKENRDERKKNRK